MRGWLLRIALSVALLAAVLTGCGETNQQAIVRISPLYKQKRADLRLIAESLPPPGSASFGAPPPTLDPPPIHDRFAMTYNTEVALVEDLLDPEWNSPNADDFDPILSNQLFHCLAWTGPKNPMHPDARKKRGHLFEECEEPLRYRYLVALRKTVMRLPEELQMEGFFIDMVKREVSWTFLISLRSDFKAEDLGRGPFAEQARGNARSSLFMAVRCAISAKLSEIPGSMFDFENDWAGSPRTDQCSGAGDGFRIEGALQGAQKQVAE